MIPVTVHLHGDYGVRTTREVLMPAVPRLGETIHDHKDRPLTVERVAYRLVVDRAEGNTVAGVEVTAR